MAPTHGNQNRNQAHARAFTLTEMLIAVAVLAVVILATSTIFGTAQRIASLGQANEDLLQQAASIERRIRMDVERMSRDGFLAIQCVGVPNNINAGTGRLLDPDRGANEEIRCDQLLFFAEGATPSGRFTQGYANNSEVMGIGTLAPAQSMFASIQYGPGVQLPIQPPGMNGVLLDFNREDMDIFPWSFITPDAIALTEWPNDTPSGAVVPVITPNANNWLLTRQAVLLADDDGGSVINNPNWFMGTDEYGPNSAGSLFYQDDSSTSDPIFRFDPWVANSRVDVAATDANSLRDQVCFTWAELGNSNQLPNVPSPLVRKDEVLEAMYLGYPRGAASAPSMDRMDVMLSNAVLSPNVSEFRVEWTWADGVGRDLDAKFGAWNAPNGGVYQEFSGGLPGVVVDGSYLRNGATRAGSTPWFGLADATLGVAPASAFSPGSGNGSWSYFGSPDDYNSVRIGPPVGSEFGSFVATNLEDSRGSTPLSNIEFCDFCDQAPASGIRRYGAVFGYNGSEGIARQANGEPLPYNGGPVFGSGVFQSSPGGNYQVANTYTPWPTAVRITMRLHDPRNKITGGRLFQFVIPIPSPE